MPSWIEKTRTHWRLRDRVNHIKVTVIKNLGTYKGYANQTMARHHEAVALGFSYSGPVTVADIDNFLKAKREGKEVHAMGRRITVNEMIEIYARLHGPSLKGGINLKYGSPYYNFERRLILFRRAWGDRFADELHKYDVRDFLAHYPNIGTQMKYLGTLSHMFRCFYDWNDDNVLGYQVSLPKYNPAYKWRREMKPAQKRENPDTRVLSPEEWQHFRKFLKPRTLAICELGLLRTLRKADIREFSDHHIAEGEIRGIQQKTGEVFSVPVLRNQPARYDFTNFKRDFQAAQRKAGMDWPASDPRHFSFKDLRRSGAMWGYRQTKDIAAVADMLGHRDYKTTKRYLNITHSDRQRIAAAIDRVGNNS